ncbi:protein-disulfide isomerase [Mycolicibacterium sp. BK556]|uniref:hypothetical protein n=1 Tax=Mycobacteriaceae TaxID=1762 RepID=UPI00105D48E4|nr:MULTISPECIES: hypothetical protein [Mycobacteriaceae]MBB3606206.1 protein-disulfide isomerase [Mycolicibacterium sp. BK556]MBB3632784.1 protein-disulfide isomerase [Mycolicibacterium sp. BK607]MBB3754133.1 protein-disulfide isomerase [Mycolicibacterium sp. BK634]
MNATRGPGAVANRNWFSAVLGALGILALGVLVAAVVSMSHESAHPVGQPRPAATTTASVVPVHSTAPVPSSSAQPPASWSVTAVASTLATPPAPAAQPREPSVRQRLHDMFPRLIPGH